MPSSEESIILIKPTVVGMIGRGHSHMPFPDRSREVSGILKLVADQFLGFGNAMLIIFFRAITTDGQIKRSAKLMGIPPGHQTHATRPAKGMGHIARGKDHTTMSQSIQVRRPDILGVIEPYVGVSQVITQNDDEIRPVLGQGASQQGDRRHQNRTKKSFHLKKVFKFQGGGCPANRHETAITISSPRPVDPPQC